MFKQFTENINANQAYLLFSLGIFFVFFIVVTIMLIRIRKAHVDHMRDLPLQDSLNDLPQPLQS
jgi:cbb3-type cytochrome oxidase subunit 3